MKLFFDGASKGNPGESGCGFYIIDEETEFCILGKKYIGNFKTNNDAEYLGLINGLKKITDDFDTSKLSLQVYGDSKLVIEQMKGDWKINAKNLIKHHKKAQVLSKKFKDIEFFHILRNKNSIADRLANESIYEHNNSIANIV